MSDRYEYIRFSKYCSTCGQQFYKAAFEAAEEFIDSHVSDPDQTNEMCRKYAIYIDEVEKLRKLNIDD